MHGNQIDIGFIVAKVRYLKQKKSGLYMFRRGIPESIQPFFDGKKHIVKSLGTHDKNEAVRKVSKLYQWSERLFEEYKATGERDLAIQVLKKAGLRDTPIESQSSIDTSIEGNLYDQFMEDCSYEAYVGGGYDNNRLSAGKKKAIQILHGEEIHTLELVKVWSLKRNADNKKTKQAIIRSFEYFSNLGVDGDIAKIYTQDVIEAIETLLSGENKKATDTVSKALQLVRNAIKDYAIAYRIQLINPFDKVKIPKAGKDVKKRHTFSNEELRVIKNAISENEETISAQVAGLQFNTGCRIGEIGGLLLEDIRLEEAIPYLRILPHERRELKNENSERHIPLTGISLNIAKIVKKRAIENQIYAFPKYFRDNKYKGDNCSAAVNKWIKVRVKAGTSHSFRHKMTDRLKDAGIPQPEIENIQGWTSNKMVNYYGTTKALEALSKALELLEAHETKKQLL